MKNEPLSFDNVWSDPISVISSEVIELYIAYNPNLSVTLISKDNKFQFPKNAAIAQFPQYEVYKTLLSGLSISVADDMEDEISISQKANDVFQLTLKFTSSKDITFRYINWVEYISYENNHLDDYLNQNLYNNLSILNMNDQISYAFTSRLIEYLSNNVITSVDKFSKNIENISKKLLIPGSRLYKNIKLNGTWDNYKRIQAFELTNKYAEEFNYTPFKDINGFIDKNTELALHNFKAYSDLKIKE